MSARSVAYALSVLAISLIRCVRREVAEEGITRGEMTGAVGERVMGEGKRGAFSIPNSLAALGGVPRPFNMGTEGDRIGRARVSTARYCNCFFNSS